MGTLKTHVEHILYSGNTPHITPPRYMLWSQFNSHSAPKLARAPKRPQANLERFRSRAISVLDNIDRCSPVILQRNWLREAEKFFDPERLSVKPWTLHGWLSNNRPDTVWVVKLSWLQRDTEFHQLVTSAEFKTNVEIMSSWSDECHLFSRSDQSNQ